MASLKVVLVERFQNKEKIMETKRILLNGKNSYIGKSFIKHWSENENDYVIDELRVRGENWGKFNFTPYDSVFHISGIAHNSEDPKLKELYYEVNRDLTVEIALQAKESGVKQFIIMSSMIIFGNELSGKTFIGFDTKSNPDNFYMESKLQAEIELRKIEESNFKVAIIRPPMVYSANSKGNYLLLAKLAKKTPIFPDYTNKRSMLYVGNLCRFVTLIIKNDDSGTYYFQNSEYIQKSKMVKQIAETHKHSLVLTKVLKFTFDKMFRLNIIKKDFGDLYYDQTMSHYDKGVYQQINFAESIGLTEGIK